MCGVGLGELPSGKGRKYWKRRGRKKEKIHEDSLGLTHFRNIKITMFLPLLYAVICIVFIHVNLVQYVYKAKCTYNQI